MVPLLLAVAQLATVTAASAPAPPRCNLTGSWRYAPEPTGSGDLHMTETADGTLPCFKGNDWAWASGSVSGAAVSLVFNDPACEKTNPATVFHKIGVLSADCDTIVMHDTQPNCPTQGDCKYVRAPPPPPPPPPCKASCDHCVDVPWLTCRTKMIVEGCREPIHADSPLRRGNNATLAYTPDASHGYNAQWTRDFQYTVSGASELMDAESVKKSVRYTFAGQRADGCMPDRVQIDGLSVMAPDGAMPGNKRNPNHDHAWDNMPFAALLLASTVQAWPDKQMFCELEPQARQALNFVNRSSNHLVYNSVTHPNCTYGFTDSVAKTGNLLFCSLLYVDASRQMAALSKKYGCGDTAQYAREAAEVGGAIDALKDPAGPLWFAATIDNRIEDVWGTAYLVALNLSSSTNRQAAMDDMVAHPDVYLQKGQVRSMPKGKYWTRCCFSELASNKFCAGSRGNGTNQAPGCPGLGTYQNGAYWATPLSYLTQALLATGHRSFAQKVLTNATDNFKVNGIFEAVDYIKPGAAPYHGVLNYTASATNALWAAQLLLKKPLKSEDESVDAGSTIQLVADDFIIASTKNLTRTMHSPQASFQTVIKPDAVWEADFAIGLVGTSVVVDGSTIRMFYALRNRSLGCGHGDQPPCSAKLPPQPNYEPSAGQILTALAESTDGGNSWTKPLLNRFSIHGSKANNVLGPIFKKAPREHENVSSIDTVFIDPNAANGSTKRYRGVTGSYPSYSKDGVSWTLGEEPWDADCSPLFIGDWGTCGDDTKPAVFWDPWCAGGKGCWSFYTRYKNNVPPRPITTQESRMVRRACSFSLDPGPGEKDRLVWHNESLVMRADGLDNKTHTTWSPKLPPMDYYGSTPWVSNESPVYWMSATRFWHFGPSQNGPRLTREMPGSYDLALAFSRDGANWSYVAGRRSWVGPGRDGTAGSRRMWLTGPPVRVGDEELYFVSRANTAEGINPTIDPLADAWLSDVAVGRLRVNGLVSLDAPYCRQSEAAVLVTKQLKFSGSSLFLNVNSAGPGSVVVEVRRAAQPLSAAPVLTSVALNANGVESLVFWSGTATSAGNATAIGALAGEAVVLTLKMQAASLYSLRFKADDAAATQLFNDSASRDVIVQGGQFVNVSTGKKTMLIGANVVMKGPPWIPEVSQTAPVCDTTNASGANTSCQTFGVSDALHLTSTLDYNMIRLGVSWAGGQPNGAGTALDAEFVRRLRAVLDLCHVHGIAVLLDIHQDAVGSAVCGEGVPAWFAKAALGDKFGKPIPGLPAQADGSCSEKDTGNWSLYAGEEMYNVKNPCCRRYNQGSWGQLGGTTHALTVMQHWLSKPGRAQYAQYAGLLAAAVEGYPAAFGIELMNEPPSIDRYHLYILWQECYDAIRNVSSTLAVSVQDTGQASLGLGSIDLSDQTKKWLATATHLFYAFHWYMKTYVQYARP